MPHKDCSQTRLKAKPKLPTMLLAHFSLPSIFTQIISQVSDNTPIEEVQQVQLSLCFLLGNEVSSTL